MGTSPPLARRSPCVVVAEDDDAMRCMLAEELRRDGCEVIEAANGEELLDSLATVFFESDDPGRTIDLIVSDLRMPKLTGMDVLCVLRLARRNTPLILITAFGNEDTRSEACELGAVAVLDKPFDVDDLRAAIREAVSQC
jgi:DNA-binding response OmpR family regulator